GVCTVLHDGAPRRVPPPLAEDLDAADRQRRVDGHGLGDLADESLSAGPVLRRGTVGTDVPVEVRVVEHVERVQAGRLDQSAVQLWFSRAPVLFLCGVDV